MNIKKKFVGHVFFYFVALVIVVSAVMSFYRFIVLNDYLVSYEGNCDPTTESCFVGCEDDECTSEYYYTEIIKYAPDLEKECGINITDCEAANICLPTDRECSITYCDPEIDGGACAVLEEMNEEDLYQIDLTEDESLPVNNDINI